MSCSAWVSRKIDTGGRQALGKIDTGGRQALGKLAASPLLDPLDFDVPEMRLATGIGSSLSSKHSD